MKLREPFTYFVDRSLGREVVVTALRAAGESALAHDDHLPQNTPDTEWLSVAGARGWIVLTKDKHIRLNRLELRAFVDANVAVFMLGRGDLSGPKTGRCSSPLCRKFVEQCAGSKSRWPPLSRQVAMSASCWPPANGSIRRRTSSSEGA